MTPAELLVRASVWLALVGYLAGALHACAPRRGAGWSRAARVAWTLGCVAFLVHVVSAFHVYFEWSHTIALEETTRQTAALTGRDTGAGLYLNYLFTALWTLDVAWWWRGGLEAYRARPAALAVALHGFLFFMVFNGTVVFGDGPVRWLGVGITLLLAAALLTFRPWRSPAP